VKLVFGERIEEFRADAALTLKESDAAAPLARSRFRYFWRCGWLVLRVEFHCRLL
jgi:hypothetical protein